MTELHGTNEMLSAAATTPAPTEEPPTRRTGLLGHLLVAVAVVMALGAIGAVIVGLNAQAETDNAKERTAALTQERRAQDAAHDEAVDDRERVEQLADDLSARADDAANAFTTAEDAQFRFTEMTNRGADVFNNGDVAGSEAIFRDEGTALLDEVRTTQDAANAALAAFHDARDDLEEAVR